MTPPPAPPQVTEHCCDSLPLALSILGSTEALKAPRCRQSDDDPDEFWKQLHCQLGNHQDVGRGRPLAVGRTSSFGCVVDLCLSELDLKSRECFRRLGVLPEGTVAPLDMLSHLWDQVNCSRVVI